MYLFCAVNRSLNVFAVLQRGELEPRLGLAGGTDLSQAEEPVPRRHRFISPTLCVKWPYVILGYHCASSYRESLFSHTSLWLSRA